MKSLILFVAIFVAVSALPRSQASEPKGWYVPIKGGKFKWVWRDEYENSTTKLTKRVQVKFYLYTKSNPANPTQLYLNDKGTLSSSNFRASLPTRVIIHGWDNDFKSAVNTDIRSALLNIGAFNVICVDWSDKSVSLNYASSKNAVPDVGRQVANFLDFLRTQGGMSFDTLTIIGHCLGAHVAGFTGKRVNGARVNTIIGLDPAYPLFSYWDSSKRLSSKDATYVESIHTSGSILGFLEPIGQAAFYPNGGKSQPGCGIDYGGPCGHTRAYQYYAEAIQRNSFKSISCLFDYNAAINNKCGNSFSSIRMGTGYLNSGVFYVPINQNSPYGTA